MLAPKRRGRNTCQSTATMGTLEEEGGGGLRLYFHTDAPNKLNKNSPSAKSYTQHKPLYVHSVLEEQVPCKRHKLVQYWVGLHDHVPSLQGCRNIVPFACTQHKKKKCPCRRHWSRLELTCRIHVSSCSLQGCCTTRHHFTCIQHKKSRCPCRRHWSDLG